MVKIGEKRLLGPEIAQDEEKIAQLCSVFLARILRFWYPNAKKFILNKTVMCCSPVLMTRVTASELNLN